MELAAVFVIFFFASAISVFVAAKQMKKMKVLGRDINKPKKIFLPEATGIAMLVPLWIGIFFVFFSSNPNQDFFILGLAVSGCAVIGLLDDFKKKTKGNIAWKKRAVPVALFALAFSAIVSPNLLFIPLFALYIAGLAGLQNTFAGLNGWEIGSGFIIAGFVAMLLANTQFFLIAIIFSAIVLGMLFWNCFPAKVFPGDSGTLLIGGAIASMLVLTQNVFMMFFSLLFFLPHIVDFFLLKMLTNKKDPSQKKILPYSLANDDRIRIPDYPDKQERLDFAKLIIKIFGPLKEWQVVAIIWAIVFLNCAFWFFVFKVAMNIIF